MRPLTVLLGILMGSTVSMAVGLLLTWVVFLFMPEHEEIVAAERAPLAQAIAIFTTLAIASSASFYGELRGRTWRIAAQLLTVCLLGVAVWVYWPR